MGNGSRRCTDVKTLCVRPTPRERPMTATQIIVVATLVAVIAVTGLVILWLHFVERQGRRQQEWGRVRPEHPHWRARPRGSLTEDA